MHERKKAAEDGWIEDPAPPPHRGPRGGTTTISDSGMVKKNFWLPRPLAEALRRAAFETRRSEAEMIREALERFLADRREGVG